VVVVQASRGSVVPSLTPASSGGAVVASSQRCIDVSCIISVVKSAIAA
jgi:hypothetical protein